MALHDLAVIGTARLPVKTVFLTIRATCQFACRSSGWSLRSAATTAIPVPIAGTSARWQKPWEIAVTTAETIDELELALGESLHRTWSVMLRMKMRDTETSYPRSFDPNRSGWSTHEFRVWMRWIPGSTKCTATGKGRLSLVRTSAAELWDVRLRTHHDQGVPAYVSVPGSASESGPRIVHPASRYALRAPQWCLHIPRNSHGDYRLYRDYRGSAYAAGRNAWELTYTVQLNSDFGEDPTVVRARQDVVEEALKAGLGESADEIRVVVDIGGDRGQFIPTSIPERFVIEVFGREPLIGVRALASLVRLAPTCPHSSWPGPLEHLPDPVMFRRGGGGGGLQGR